MKRYFSSIKQYSWIPLVCFILSLSGGFYLAKASPTIYTVNAIFVVNQYYSATGTTASASDLLTIATNYSSEIPTRAVTDYVIQQYPEITKRGYTANDLIADVAAAPSTTTPIVTLTATATKPRDAILLVNSVADGFTSYIQAQNQASLDAQRKQLQTQYAGYQTDSNNLAKQILAYPTGDPHIAILTALRTNDLSAMSDIQKQLDSLPATAPNNVQVVQHAQPSDVTTSSKASLILAATGVIGLILGGLVMLAVIFFDKRLRSEEQVKEKLGLAYLGGVSGNGTLKSSPTRPAEAVARELGDILANLRLTGVVKGQWQAPNGAAVLITSPQRAEGKTTLSVGLATLAARGGQAVVVVDGNLNNASTHLAFGMSPIGIGLNGLLKGSGRETVDDTVVRSKIPGIWLLPVTTPVEASAFLLEQKMPAVLSQLRAKTDLVIIDGPSLLSGADASVLATMVDGVVLVVDSRYEKLPLLKRAKEVLSSLTTTSVGVVFNHRPLQRRNKNRYFATASPSRALSEQWLPVAVSEGNGHAHNGIGVEQRADAMPLMRVLAPPPARQPIQQLDTMKPPAANQPPPLSRAKLASWQITSPPPLPPGRDEN